MKRVNDIFNHKLYKKLLKKLEAYEINREFCRHDMDHFLAMSRIAYIKVLEQGLPYSKEIIYAIGLLHDIGRVAQYEEGMPHDEASVKISEDILKNIDFTNEEKLIILNSIASHRCEVEGSLESIIYKSDKLSRECFKCKAEKECYWSKERKNLSIIY